MLDKSIVKQQIRSKQSHKIIIALIICLALSAKAQPCEAQYVGFGSGLGYNGLGSSLLYPLFYSGYGTSYAWPLYGLAALGSGFANNAIYNSYRNIPYNYMGNYPYNNNYANYSANNYPLATPPSTNYPYNYNPNQNQASGWIYSPNQPLSTPQQNNDPNDIFNSGSPLNTSDPNWPNKAPAPPVAPDRHVLSQTFNGMLPSSFAPDTRNLALEGFFQTVNTRYKGNLFHALDHLDMRAWAASIGLIHPGQQFTQAISSARKGEISTIMKDSSLDSQKKFDILRLLLASPQ